MHVKVSSTSPIQYEYKVQLRTSINREYQLEGKVITWWEPCDDDGGGVVLSLSFQDTATAGCNDIWQQIMNVQNLSATINHHPNKSA